MAVLAQPDAFFRHVRTHLFGGHMAQSQVDGINAIIEAWSKYGDGDARKLAYILATAHHETGAFKWLHEIWGPTAAQSRYEGRSDLGNSMPGDGKRFMGRGFVQLTGRRNYTDWARRTGLDLVGNPDLVTQPAVAARILVQGSMLGTFTGKALAAYIDANQTNYVSARRIINGTDKAALIAGYAEMFAAALKGGVSAAPKPVPAPGPKPTAPMPEPVNGRGPAPTATKPSKGPLAAILGVLIAIGAAAVAYLKSKGIL